MATILGTNNGDSLTSGAESDVLLGLGGSDTLLGRGGSDSLSGSDGDDLINGGTGADTMSGGDGEDTFVILQGDTSPTAPDVITDWTAEDRFSLGTGPGAYQETTAQDAGRLHANSLIAAGARFVAVQTPQGVILYIDTAVNGGEAEDAILLAGRTLDDIAAVNVGSADTLPTAPPGVPDPANPNPPPPPPAPPPPPTAPINGTSGADTLQGGATSETLNGLGGDDVIAGGGGDDVLDGGEGIDTVTYAASSARMFISLEAGIISEGAGDQGRDRLSGFERVIGTAFDDTIVGVPLAETLNGGQGNDLIAGRGGMDRLLGEGGNDELFGSGVMLGGAGNDTLTAQASGNADTQLDGEAGNDWLTGSTNAETLAGGAGDDTLDGGFAADQLTGGAGADRFMASGGRSTPAAPDRILDWEQADRLDFGASLFGSYSEGTAGSADAALQLANTRIGSGSANFVAVQVGGDVFVFADAANNDGAAEEAVVLVGRTLADISLTNFVSAREPEPTAPLGVGGIASPNVAGQIAGSMDAMRLSAILSGGTVITNTANRFELDAGALDLAITGTGLTYRQDSSFVYEITGGVVNSVLYQGTDFRLNFTIASGASAVTLFGWMRADAAQVAFATLLTGNDNITGGTPRDVLYGYGGNDFINGLGGSDTIWGGAGDDIIRNGFTGAGVDFSASTYLRGEDGNDFIVGGFGFDDINGNMGNDTGIGGAATDWVVGGKDNDLLFGEDGDDLVYGNLGSDTCVGGEGADIVRGGQDNDLVRGGGGNDFLSGDRGDDTMVGGLGADTFNTFAETGLDRVTDFRADEGDRVQLAPGTQYTVAQVGDDTVISMTGGGQMILVGVELSSLPTGWIFGA